jgi:nitrite reductase (NO-forming)
LTTLIGSPEHEAPATAGASSLSPDTAARLARGRAERRVLSVGLALIGGFAAASALSAVLGGAISWTTLHLALAGAATVGIGTFMPHFAVTLAGTEPEPAPGRLAVLGILAASAVAVTAGVGGGSGWLVVLGASGVLGGAAGTGWMTFAPLRRGIGRRHPIVQVTYLVALVELAIGVSLALLLYLGWPPVVSRWPELKLAHAWLNLLGFVSLTVAGTLVYLFPTVVGTRIVAHRSVVALVVGCVAGPAVVAVAATLGSGTLAAAGAWLTVVGALGQAWYVADTFRRRGRWAYDHDWHRVVIGHLAAGTAWFVAAGVSLAAGLSWTARVDGWSLGASGVPLLGGWVVQELIGSWSHLLPAVGPGDAATHARQRALLGRWPLSRLMALNVGVAVAWAGVALETPPLVGIGGALVIGSLAVGLLLFARALRA